MHLLKLILLFSLCIWMSANAQTPYDSFAPETSRPILTSEALSREKCAQDFSSDTTLLVAMIDRQQERILLVDMSNGSIVAYAPLTDNKCHWLSPDPMLDKYPQISPYAYCHWNPMRYIDLDGRDDLFDESGIYLRHIDNGTDYIMIENANGKQQNITDFSYNKENVASREMLANVMTFYAQQVGLDQKIGIADNLPNEENASFLTGTESRQIRIVVNNGRINKENNTSNNIMNTLVHEGDHAAKGTSGPMAEIEAIVKQVSHLTWEMTTDSYKKSIVNYLVQNANYANNSNSNVNYIIAPIMPILDISPYSIFFNDEAFSVFLNPIIK